MKCWTIERRLPAYIENSVCESEQQQLATHLRRCTACSAKVDSQRQARLLLGSLPMMSVPADLTLRLRVLASKERAAAGTSSSWPSSRFEKWRGDLWLFLDNLMKPIALPAAGGLGAALLLFTVLMPTFALNHTGLTDVPIGIFTDPAIKTVAPIGFHYGDAEVDLRIDEQGRVVNYAITSGSCNENNVLQRSIENTLLFTTFTPATAFGVPTTGTVRISFRSSHIDVKG